MKLRIRSLETRATTKIETPNPCSICQLKSLVAAHISAASPESLHLSLNRKDEIDGEDRTTIESLGLISGDLIFYTTSTLDFSRAPSGGDDFGTRGRGDVAVESTGRSEAAVPLGVGMVDCSAAPVSSTASAGRLDCCNFEKKVIESESSDKDGTGPEVADLEMDDVASEEDLASKERVSSFSFPGILKRVMEEESGIAVGDLGLFVIAVHAVFLESGFVVCGANGGSQFPEGKGGMIMVPYTLAGLESVRENAAEAPIIRLRFTQVGKFVNVYGSVAAKLGVYRVSFDASWFLSSLALSVDKRGKNDEMRLFELWKIVKDGLSLPLLIDINEKCGLPPPPCFARLPSDVKLKILEMIPGVDLARIGCVNKELSYLSCNDELWRKKFLDEFELFEGEGLLPEKWKHQFKINWVRRKNKDLCSPKNDDVAGRFDDHITIRRPYWRHPTRFGAPGFNIIGGDYDRFPAIGGIGTPGRTSIDIPRLLHRQNFSPRCNFSRSDGF